MRSWWIAVLGAAALAGCSPQAKSPDLVYDLSCADECRQSYQACRAAEREACGYAEQQCLRTCSSWLAYPDGRRVDMSN